MFFAHRKSQTQAFIFILFGVACLAACAPTPNDVVLPSKTATRRAITATITPKPTLTPANTPTSIPPLPVVAIPETPTPGARLITVRNAGNVEVLDTFGNGQAYHVGWSPNSKLMTIDTSLGSQVYDTETWQQIKVFGEERDMLVVWSPDGKLLATVEEYAVGDQPVSLYDGETLELIKVLQKGSSFQWSLVGEILAISSSSGIYLYDMRELNQPVTIRTGEYPGDYRFSPDGKTIAALRDGRVRLWDTTTGKPLSTFENFMESNSYVYNFEYSPNGKNLLVLDVQYDVNFQVSILDVITGKISYIDQGRLEYGRAARAIFRPDGLEMVLQTYKTVSIVDVNSGRVRKNIELPYDDYADNFHDLAYSPDGKKLITTAGIFDIESGTQLTETGFTEFTLSQHGGLVAGSPIGGQNQVLLWDLQKDEYLRTIPAFYTWMHSASVSPDERKIVVFDEFGNVQIYDTGTGDALRKIRFNDDIFSIAFGPKTAFSTGYLLAVAEETGAITVWDVGNHQVIRTFLGTFQETNPVAISPNGRQLAYHAREGGLHIADIASGKVLRELSESDHDFKNLVFSPDGKTLVASGDGTISGGVSVWDVTTSEMRLKLGFGANLDFDFLPHTNLVVLANQNLINFWDVSTGDFIAELKKENAGEYESYYSTAISSDGHLLAAGTTTDLIDIWDVEKRQLLRTITSSQFTPGFDGGYDATIKGLAFNPHTHILASLGANDSIWVWDADSGRSLSFGAIKALAFSPDGSLWAAGWYGQVRLFALPTLHK